MLFQIFVGLFKKFWDHCCLQAFVLPWIYVEVEQTHGENKQNISRHSKGGTIRVDVLSVATVHLFFI